MSQIILGQMLEKLRFLEPVELQQLNHAVQDRLVNQPEINQTAVDQPTVNPEDAFQQALIDSGLVRPRQTDSLQESSQVIVRRLVPVQGEPVSQTIIEERR
jgi:hypothetical protein